MYTGIVVIITLAVDQVIDTFITPRIMARTLKVHPAAVLVAALIAANLLGLLGVVIAAPFLATILLLGRYVMRKMFDLDPWPPVEAELPSAYWLRVAYTLQAIAAIFLRSNVNKMLKSDKEKTNEQ